MFVSRDFSLPFINQAYECYKTIFSLLFSDGQSITTRLAKQINRITKSIKKDIEKYNNEDHGMIPPESLPLTMGFDDIKDPDCPFWLMLHAPNADSNESQISIPLTVKRKAIDLCHLLDRAKEEQALLKEEMRNAFLHYQQQHDLITDFVLATDNPILNELQSGELLFCRRKLLHVESRLHNIHQTFSPHIHIELPRMFIMTEDQSDNEDAMAEEDQEEAVIVNFLTEESDSDYEYESDSDFSNDDIFL